MITKKDVKIVLWSFGIPVLEDQITISNITSLNTGMDLWERNVNFTKEILEQVNLAWDKIFDVLYKIDLETR
jgi:hypothetical protein